jgi:hypothetical protein
MSRLTYFCYGCYGANEAPWGRCRNCGGAIEAPTGTSHTDPLVAHPFLAAQALRSFVQIDGVPAPPLERLRVESSAPVRRVAEEVFGA